MALFQQSFVEEVVTLVRRRHQELQLALGHQPGQQEAGAPSPLRRDLELLVRVANGEYLRANAGKALVHQVDSALRNLMQLLLGNVVGTHVAVPDEFWNTKIGVLVSRVRWWLSADELITISNAAALAFGENSQANRMRIARAMDKGLLEWAPDPSVANPQQNRRVLRSQVEQLRERSSLPE